jgi:hypothetical protein
MLQPRDDMDGDPLDIIFKADWNVPRHGTVTEFRRADDELRYKVEIWDEGRSPFLVRWFNDPTSAADFVERLSTSG